MKERKIEVVQTVQYVDAIQVFQPTNMTNEQFHNALSQAEQKNKTLEGGAKELASILRELGVEAKLLTYSFPDSPHSSELAIENIIEVKKHKLHE
ncbi:hypothetical protein NDS46_30560 (plasmid) [Paenibacillus thiaminolyticus]|uniref:hypothetical protein n=1 Tax=Paenibacillus thiaminolyticus TaxID=49283 RepID=UPI00232AE9DF|nr:hypothetical protein [Paenibacillus thiaminolyticus]WCF11692.1 hypothetical protein NDS46_30560 [Paenibacillus thiaminolyticus]